MGVTTVPWHRYGHRRTYVNDDDGTSLGYRDDKTGEVTVMVPAREEDVRRALAALAAQPVPPKPVVPPKAAAPPAPPKRPVDPVRSQRAREAMHRRLAERSWHAPTLSEKALADELVRSSPFAWQRELPWDRYRLDFYCAAARLAVEVDGSSHRNRADRDVVRDAFFHAHGVETERIPAADVERDPAAVVAHLNRLCIQRAGRVPPAAVPAPGLFARLLGRTRPVTPQPLAPAEYAGRRKGGTFVCARCRCERPPAQRSVRTASCCTACAP